MLKTTLKTVLLALVAITITACSSAQPRPADAPESLNTYLKTDLLSVDEVTSRLTKAGFEIIGSTKVAKKKMTSVVFTHPALKELANRPSRGLLAASMRVLINPVDKETKITSPYYFIKAYLQADYKVGDETIVQDAIKQAFPLATYTEDKYSYDGLPNYHFMIGMPYYHEQLVVGKADTLDELLKKAKKAKKKAHVFTLELSPERYVVGLNLSKRTSKFTSKIGNDKASLLPWSVLIEYVTVDGKKEARATALAAQYHIALSYPLLDMGGFMGIMTIPGSVDKELKKIFK